MKAAAPKHSPIGCKKSKMVSNRVKNGLNRLKTAKNDPKSKHLSAAAETGNMSKRALRKKLKSDSTLDPSKLETVKLSSAFRKQ